MADDKVHENITDIKKETLVNGALQVPTLSRVSFLLGWSEHIGGLMYFLALWPVNFIQTL